MEGKDSFLKKVQSALQEWEGAVLKKRLMGDDDPQFRTYSGALREEAKTEFKTGSGDLIVKRLYTPLDLKDTEYTETIGFPGQYPFTRGRDPLGYRAWEWPLYFYMGYGRPEDTNGRLRELYLRVRK